MEGEYRSVEFDKGLEELGVSLTAAQRDQFYRFYRMLIEWNRKMNLTTITGWDDVVVRHFLDSLSLLRVVPDLDGQYVIDVGTGAGFPGIPLKIAFPGIKMVLADSVNKKLGFLNAVIGTLGLRGVSTAHGRAEDLAHEAAYRQRFDLCLSRAVADLAVLAEYGLPFVRIGGRLVAYKSADAEEECARAIKAVRLLGGETERIVKYRLPGLRDERSLVCIEKKEGTPQAYPRKAGTPARDPLP